MEEFCRILFQAATGGNGSYLPVVMPTRTFPLKKDITNNIWFLNKDAVDDLACDPYW